MQERRSKLASGVESSLDYKFGYLKIEVCAFTAKKVAFIMAMQFQGVSLLSSESIVILEV